MIDYLDLIENDELIDTLSFENAIYEFNKSMSEINSAMCIADARIESMITEGVTEIRPILEGAVNDAFKKIGELFERFINWVKSVFKKMAENFRKATGARDPKRYDKTARSKSTKGFSYTMFVYDEKYVSEYYEKTIDKVRELVNKELAFMDTLAKNPHAERPEIDIFHEVTGSSKTDMVEDFMTKARGGLKEPVEIHEFSKGPSPLGMSMYIQFYPMKMDIYNMAAKTMDTMSNRVKMKIQDAGRHFQQFEEESEANEYQAEIRKSTTELTKLFSLYQNIIKICSDMNGEIYRAYNGCLSAFQHTHADAASMTSSDIDGESLLESSIKMI
jgi:DNA-binding ferritin-like protein